MITEENFEKLEVQIESKGWAPYTLPLSRRDKILFVLIFVHVIIPDGK